MGLSPDEIGVLNEIARRTAEEDPAYTRRMMSYDRPRHRKPVVSRPYVSRRFVSRPYAPHLPHAFIPALLMGIALIAISMTVFGVVARHAGSAHARPVQNATMGVSSQVR